MTFYIGNQTAFFTTNPEEPFEYALAQHFTAFEWFADKREYDGGWSTGWFYDDLSNERALELMKITQKNGIRFSVHASCVATPLTHEGMKDIFKAVEVADEIGAKLINIHYDESSSPKEFVQSLEPVIIATHVRGIELAIENTPLHTPENFNAIFNELEKSGAESTGHVGMCIDIGHANCCEATRNDYIGFIDRLNENVRIIHAHVHENWGDSDSHLPLFTAAAAKNDTGVRLFIDRLKERNYSGSLIMEQWPDEHEILNNIFVRLSGIIGDEAKAQLDYSDEVAVELTVESRQLEDVVELDKPVAEQAAPKDILLSEMFANIPESDSWVIREVLEFSKVRKSWRRRLEGVKELFLGTRKLDNPDLAAIAVYLRFLSTAEIPCVEDGGHYRPCHHAKAAMEIEDAIANISNKSNTWILRKIYPYLPSHAEEFMRHEPLTRIRDIAHRNDIPKELKLDIKHNLQNKLHRSAGPEDLKTAERILKIITAENTDYSASFVHEFKLFYDELKEFFNAISLEKRLLKIKDIFVELTDVIDSFIQVKSSQNALDRARSALEVRKAFAEFHSPDNSFSFSILHLADIELEDYAFATISESINELNANESAAEGGLDIIITALEHIVLNGFMEEECSCILSEVKCWKHDVLSEPDQLVLLRLWASIQRGMRLCSTFADIVTQEFTGAVVALGKAFKIPRHAVEVYCEGDIRANLIFQLSRILGRTQRVLRAKLAFAPWSVVNGGFAKGILVQAKSLEEFEEREGEYIVVLEHAQGDEEIPVPVKGILLSHPIAHLSHLGVRSRSGGVPFAAVEDVASLKTYKEMLGTEISLEFNQYGVCVVPEITDDYAKIESELIVPEVDVANEIAVLKAGDVRAKNCGAKAGASAELYELSERFSGFVAPKVMAIPYGVMELCLERDAESLKEYNNIVSKLDFVSLDELDDLLGDIVQVILSLKVPENILQGIVEEFTPYTLFAVRSSSSGEDLEGFAGAGLYDSVIGVTFENIENAIKEVWASKWTKRGVLSRKKYGISHSLLYMGVLIQEIVNAEYAFVMHTANPITGKSGEAGIELVVGFGETLASANQAGSPCSIKYYKEDDRVEIERCADISNALVLSDIDSKLTTSVIDYSKFEAFLGDKLYRIARDLCIIGFELENHFGVPQDIEGAFSGEKYYVVQSRAQSGIEKE